MKKRILGLLLALCLVVGLLPVAALADEPVKALLYTTTTGNSGSATYIQKGDAPRYFVTGTGFVVSTGATVDNYNVKWEWPADSATPILSLRGAAINLTGNYTALRIGGTYGSNAESVGYDVKIIVEADSSINSEHLGLTGNHKGAMTITSVNNAKLSIKCTNSYSSLSNLGDLTLLNANVSINHRHNTAVHAKGNMLIENSTFAIENNSNTEYAINLSDAANNESNTSGTPRTLTIKNSVVTSTRNKNNYHGAFHTDGKVYIDNSSVEVFANVKAFDVAPIVTNCASAVFGEYGNNKTKDYSEYKTAPGDTIGAYSTGGAIGYFKTEHTCTPAADDKDCTTATVCAACGKEIAPAQAAHKTTDDGDCTTALKCENAGCEVVVTEAKAAHVAGADDGDCTTAIKCTNDGCTKDAVAAKPHTADRTSCDVAVNCTVCGKVAYEAGQHSGGTATCKEKAKCEHCGKEYGELAACTPGADDGNCTTAVKCSVCGKDAVAAKTHKYTNDADTSCDNAGCTYTRKVEKDPGKAPGDSTVLVLWFSILAVSVLGFVSVMVFGKKRFVK